MTTGPECCGEPMISYLGGEAWECAVSFFWLAEECVISEEGASPPQLKESATPEHRRLYDHLVATRVVGGLG